MNKKFIITPWEVSGDIDYDKLIKEFGMQKINDQILRRIKKHTKELHYFLERGVFFCHRDLNWILDEYEKGNKFYLYTGRGPSGNTHLGHLIPMYFTKWLQESFDVKLYLQLTDDEKFLVKPKLSYDEAKKYAYENALDLIAVGFKPGETLIFSDLDYAKTLYNQAVKIAKKVTFSTAKAVFGFNNETNIGQIFFTSMQSVPAFLESVKQDRNVPCLIPYGIDQDPHFRITRDVLPKLGYYKPASICNKFIPGLGKGGKMSASDPNSTIYTTDSPQDVNRKVSNTFTGGKDTLKEQKIKGGNPEICNVYNFLYYFFEEDDKKLSERYSMCRLGKLSCGECKAYLAEKINKFLKEHQVKREKAKKVIDKFMVKD